ncbi:MAG: TonB-dependent receptor [Acidobacteria bacterium]|nr:TonB-dependent receptor [Acidobacteriota bacterium]
MATSGAQTTSGLFLLDGTDIGDYMFAATPGGASGLAIGVDMIREFRVLTNSFGAEYGRTAGGVLTVVSKSGTNQLQGTALWFHRNDNLDARDFFDGPKPEFRRNQFGGTVGGPIVKDKTFFLGSYEGLREGKGLTTLIVTPNAQAREGLLPDPRTGALVKVGVAPEVRRHLNLYPLPNTGTDFKDGTGEFRGTETRPTDEDFFSIRVDHVLSEKDTLFGRYTFRDGIVDDPFGATPVPGFSAIGDNRTQFVSAEETHVFSPTVLNTFRAAFNRNNRANPVDPVPPELAISLVPNRGLGPINVGGLPTLGQAVSRPSFSALNVFQLQDTVNFVRGSHSLKVGADIMRLQSNFDFPIFFNGTYSFDSLRSFLAGTPRNFLGAVPGADGSRGWRWNLLGFFVQDEFRVLPNLTMNLGLRYEFYSNPTEVDGKISGLMDPLKDTEVRVVESLFDDNPGTKLFAPRFGFAWDPFSNGKLAVRGGFGVFFDRVNGNLWNGQHSTAPFARTITVLSPPFPNALAGGGRILSSAITVNTTVAHRGFKYPYALQWNFTLQREIVPSTVVSATYAGSRGVHVTVQGDLNLNRWEFRDGRKFFPEGAQPLNPALGPITYRLPIGNSFYHSLQLNLKRRWSQGLQLQAAYTLSKSMNNGSTFETTTRGNAPSEVPDLFDPNLSRGLADLDVRHNFVFNSSYELPFGKGNRWLGGWQLGGIVSLASGIPFTVRNGFDRARSSRSRDVSQGPDRLRQPATESRNVGRFFDLEAFQLQPAGFFGNAGRNSVIGPGLATVDFSVIKTIPITEKVNVQWRAEMFNLFNRANFSTPGDTVTGRGAGSIIFTSANGIPVPTAGKIARTVTSSRQIQMGLKINF